MALDVTSTISNILQDSGHPQPSYLVSDSRAMYPGQFMLNNLNNDLYICSDNSDQENLIWNRLLREDQIPQSDWDQTDDEALDYIKNKPVRSASYNAPVLNVAFQISETRDAMAIYSFELVTDDELEFMIADDELMSVNAQLVSMIGAVGISSISGFVLAGKWCQLVTSGSPSMAISQVVLL